jgi:hypothetical protein
MFLAATNRFHGHIHNNKQAYNLRYNVGVEVLMAVSEKKDYGLLGCSAE